MLNRVMFRLALWLLAAGAASFTNISLAAKTIMDVDCTTNSVRTGSATAHSSLLRERLEKQMGEHDQDAAETWSDYFFALNIEKNSPEQILLERKSLMDRYSRNGVVGLASRMEIQHRDLQQPNDARNRLNRSLEQLGKLPCDQHQRQGIYDDISAVISRSDSPASEDLRCGELVIDSMFCGNNPNFRSFDRFLYTLLHSMRNKYCAKAASQRVLDLALEKGAAAGHDKDTVCQVPELTGPRYFCELWTHFSPESVLSRQKVLKAAFAPVQAGSGLSRILNFRLACAHLKCNEVSKAESLLQTALSQGKPEDSNISDFWIKVLFAECYLRSDRIGSYKKVLDEIAKEIPCEDKWKAEHNAYLYSLRAKLHMKNKQYTEAASCLRYADQWFGSRLTVKDPISEEEVYLGELIPNELSVLEDLAVAEGKTKDSQSKSNGVVAARKAIEKFMADKASNDSEMTSRKFLQSITSGDIGQPGELAHWFGQLDRSVIAPDLRAVLWSAERLKQSGKLELAETVFALVLDRYSKNVDQQQLAQIVQAQMEINLSLGRLPELRNSISNARARWGSSALVQSVADSYETHLAWLMNDSETVRSHTQSLPKLSSTHERIAQSGQKIDLAQVLVSDGRYADACDVLVSALQIPRFTSPEEGGLSRWREGAALLSLCYASTGNSARAHSILDSLRRSPPTNANAFDKSYLMFFQDQVGAVIAEKEGNFLRALRYYTQAMQWLENSTFAKSPRGIAFKSNLDLNIEQMRKKIAAK